MVKMGVSAVSVEFCQGMLGGKGMPDKWQTNELVALIKRKEDVRNCNAYRGVKLLEHALKIVEKALDKGI